MSKTILKALAGVGALAAIAAGASAIASGSDKRVSGVGADPDSGPGQMFPYGPHRDDMGRPPGPRGAFVTGATADKVGAAALAKYTGAKVERVELLPDGTYVAHVIKADGSEVHVTVDKQFAVTGTATRPPFGPPGGPGHRDGMSPPGANDRHRMRPQTAPPATGAGGSSS